MQVIMEHSALSKTSIPHLSPQGSQKTTKGGARNRRGQLWNKASEHERESPHHHIHQLTTAMVAWTGLAQNQAMYNINTPIQMEEIPMIPHHNQGAICNC